MNRRISGQPRPIAIRHRDAQHAAGRQGCRRDRLHARGGELIEHGRTTRMFTKPDNELTERYVTGKFG